MLGHRELAMQDYIGILKRRYRLILICGVVLLVVGAVASRFIPPRYTSQTLVLVEQQKVPENYVHPVVAEDLGERLASMQEQILSRSRIEPIITKYNLFAGGSKTMDDRVEDTRKAIKITQIHSEQVKGMPGFFVAFEASDAHTAQQVCGDITSLFVSENLSDREQHAEGTTDFLKQQLADSKRSLDDQDAKLATFKQKYLGKLPGTEQANAGALQALTSQLDASTQALNRLQQSETFLEAMVTQQTQQQQNVATGTGVSVDEHERELKALKEQKQTLENLYTPDYPDVVALARRISDLEAEIAKAQAAPPPAAIPDAAVANRQDSPQMLQLKFQLKAVQTQIAETKHEQGRIADQIRLYESRVESTPQVEEEFKSLTRDHDTALQFYNSLLAKMNESSMATALEQRQQGEQFRVMDAPNLPDAPTFPNPYVFAGGGLGAGFFLGMVIAGLLEYRDTSLRNERDIWAFTKLPTLAVIAHVDGLSQTADAARSRWRPFSRMNKPLESAGS